MKTRIVALTLALAGAVTMAVPVTAQAAVYVEDVGGNVSEYGDVPPLPISGNVHIEYCVGVVTGASGDGTIIYSTDGADMMYDYIAYRPYAVAVGDVIQSMFIYNADDNGYWEDDIIWRVDITPDR